MRSPGGLRRVILVIRFRRLMLFLECVALVFGGLQILQLPHKRLTGALVLT